MKERVIAFALPFLASVLLADSVQQSGDHQRENRLKAGGAVVLATPDGSSLVLTSADDPMISFVEVEGGDVTLRLSIHDASRVVVLRGSEKRKVRLRDVFADAALQNNEVVVEVLQGTGKVTVNATELQPKAETIRRRAVAPPKPKPTSMALIDQAEAAGQLDSETALLYRVYSLFADARLPAQYRGDDAGIKDSLYMAEVRRRYPMLSPATQAAVDPFLIPPAYKGSWANTAAGSHVIPLANSPRCEAISAKWGFTDGAKYPVRVWYNTDLTDADYARAVAAEIDNVIWPKLVGLMQSAPVSDANEDCNGGNGRLDVYLADIPDALGLTYLGCNPSPAFIEVSRSASKETIAHEFFHAVQDSFPLKDCNEFDTNYRWWAEASAMWAEDFLYPDTQDEHGYAPSYLGVPATALDVTDGAHEYGAYLLPFFVHRNSGNADFVRVAWQNCASQPALEAVDRAIPGGFEKVWPEFVKRNWNRDPIKDYKTWDKLSANVPARQVDFGAALDERYVLQIDLPRLSATYYDFVFSDEVSSVVFWNGVTSKLLLGETECCGKTYGSEAATADETKGAHVEALIKLSGQDWQTADWTNRPYVKFCCDVLAEHIEQLVLIVSNSEFKDRERRLKPSGLAPVILASKIGCWQWKGTATHTENLGGSTLTISTNVTWTPDEATLPQKQPSLVLYKAAGTQSWSVTGRCSGSGTVPIDPMFSALITFNGVPPESSLYRTYFGSGNNAGVDLPVRCDTGQNTISLSDWWQPPLAPILPGVPLPGARFVYVKGSGKVIDDTNMPPSEKDSYSWHFEAQRQQ